jgi:hypothetical protein
MIQQRKWAILLIRISAIFGFIGVVIGSMMSGQENYAYKPVHAHVTLVGWLSVFAWGIFYYAVPLKKLIFVKVQAIFGIIGAIGLTTGMYVYNFYDETWAMVFFIVGGTVLLLAFALFILSTFLIKKENN